MTRDGRIQTGLALFVPCGLRALRSLKIAGAIIRTAVALIRPPISAYKKAPLKARLVVYGAQGRSKINSLEAFYPLRASRVALFENCWRNYSNHGGSHPTPDLCIQKSPAESEACCVWCPGAESNHRHEDFQSSALPTELPGHILTCLPCLHTSRLNHNYILICCA